MADTTAEVEMNTRLQTHKIRRSPLIVFCIAVIAAAPMCYGQALQEQEALRLPVMFTKNAGQWDAEICYAGMDGAPSVLFSRDGIVIPALPAESGNIPFVSEGPFSREPFRLSFIGRSENLSIIPEHPCATVSNFYTTADSTRWATGARNYDVLRYVNVWKGVDIEYSHNNQTLLQSIIVDDEAALSRVRFFDNGGTQLRLVRSKSRGEQDADGSGVQLVRHNGITGFSSSQPLPEGGLILCTEISSAFIGPSSWPEIGFDVDADGNMYIASDIKKRLTPLVNSIRNYTDDEEHRQMVMKVGCDGSILYNSYLGTGSEDRRIYIKAQTDGSAIIAAPLLGKRPLPSPLEFPVTSDAARPNVISYNNKNYPQSADIEVIKLSPEGNLIYASWLGLDGPPRYLKGVACDRNDNIYVYGTLLTLKSDSLPDDYRIWGNAWSGVSYDSNPRSNTAKGFRSPSDSTYVKEFIIKLSPDCKTTLYGSYFPCASSMLNSMLNVVITSEEDLIMAFDVEKSDLKYVSLPLVNPVHDTVSGVDSDSYLFKLNRNGVDVDFAGFMNFRSLGLQCDSKDNVIVAGSSSDQNLPLVSPLQDYIVGLADTYVMKLSPAGDILRSTYLGTPVSDNIHTIVIDRHDNIGVLISVQSENIPVNSAMKSTHTIPDITSMNAAHLVLLSEQMSSVLYSCRIGNANIARKDNHGNLYFAGSSGYQNIMGVTHKIWNPQLVDTAYNAMYPFVVKLRPPIEDWALPDWHVTTSADTIHHSELRRIYHPRLITVTATLKNIAPVNIAERMTAEIILPPGVTLEPPTQERKIDFGAFTLGPGDSTTLVWTVTLDNLLSYPDNIPLRFYCEYTWPELQTNCPVPCSNGEKVIHISREPVEHDISCLVDGSDTLFYAMGGIRPLDTTWTAAFGIRNAGDKLVHLDYAELDIPPDQGITLAPGEKVRMYVGTSFPGQDMYISWKLQIETWHTSRFVALRMRTVDSLGYEALNCEIMLYIPGVQGLECLVAAPREVLYDLETGATQPSPIPIALHLKNILSVSADTIEARINLGSVPHIGLVANEDVIKQFPAIAPGSSEIATWYAACSVIVQDEVDTVFVQYRISTDTTWYECAAVIQILARNGFDVASCTISAPTDLAPDAHLYTPNPFDLNYTLLNTGNAQLDVAEIAIQLPAYITTTDAITRTVSPLAASAQHDITWSLTALTSSYDREAVITVVARDAEGNILSSCEHRVFIPGVDGLSCDAGENVTLVYNIDESKYEPSMLVKQITVYNQLDTALTNVEIEATVSSNEIAITSPSPSKDAVSVIPANDTWITDWDFNVIGSDVATTVTVTYRSRSDQFPEWRECSFEVIVPPREYTYCADCLADGIDTVWIDRSNEIMYPVPFQVYTAVTNNCTGILTDIQCTISMPARLSLAPGEPASQMIDLLKPGETMYVMWMLNAAIGSQDDALPVQITLHNGALAPIICEHTVYIQHSNNIQLAAAKKLLYFQAAQNDALPAAQEIVVYAGFPIEMPWTAQYPAWLDLAPDASPTFELVAVQPNTTALPMQRHYGIIAYSSAHPNAPKNVEVVYDIVATVGTKRIPAAAQGIVLHQNYPNPFASSTTISYTTDISQSVSIAVYNTLGVAVREMRQEAQQGNNELSISGLKPGIYMVVLQSREGAATRLMVAR